MHQPPCWVQDAWGNAQDYALNAGDAAFLTLDGTVHLMGLAASSFQASINSTLPGVHQLQASRICVHAGMYAARHSPWHSACRRLLAEVLLGIVHDGGCKCRRCLCAWECLHLIPKGPA